MKRIVVTGAAGQVGTELVPALRAAFGNAAVLATDIRRPHGGVLLDGPFETVDCMNGQAVAAAVLRHRADTIYHLAALLSASAERSPQLAYQVNMGTLVNVLEVARDAGCAVFTPSSIGAFGPTTPRDPAPQDDVRCDEGRRRAAVRLLLCALRRRHARSALPGADLARRTTRRRHDRLRGPHLPRCARARPLHLLSARGHTARHDVHAGRDP